MLPIHFGPWQTVYGWFRELARRFLFQTIHDVTLIDQFGATDILTTFDDWLTSLANFAALAVLCLLATAALGCKAEGEIGGAIPVRLADGAVIITGAELTAQGGGRIRFRSADTRQALASGGETVKLMLDALEDFRYEMVHTSTGHGLGLGPRRGAGMDPGSLSSRTSTPPSSGNHSMGEMTPACSEAGALEAVLGELPLNGLVHLGHHRCQGGHPRAAREIHDPHPRCGPPLTGDRLDGHADDHPVVGDDEDLGIGLNDMGTNDVPARLRELRGDDALTPASLPREVQELGALPVSELGHHEELAMHLRAARRNGSTPLTPTASASIRAPSERSDPGAGTRRPCRRPDSRADG